MALEENIAQPSGMSDHQVSAAQVSSEGPLAKDPARNGLWHRMTRGALDPLPTIRVSIALLRAIAALVVWFLLAPAQLETGAVRAASHSSDVVGVRAAQDVNEARADSSPRQTVVNGWATVDMLEVVTTQLDDLANLQADAFAATDARSDPRIPALLFIAVLVFCLTALVQPISRPSRPVEAALSPESSVL